MAHGVYHNMSKWVNVPRAYPIFQPKSNARNMLAPKQLGGQGEQMSVLHQWCVTVLGSFFLAEHLIPWKEDFVHNNSILWWHLHSSVFSLQTFLEETNCHDDLTADNLRCFLWLDNLLLEGIQRGNYWSGSLTLRFFQDIGQNLSLLSTLSIFSRLSMLIWTVERPYCLEALRSGGWYCFF